jgi:hypothetical protein
VAEALAIPPYNARELRKAPPARNPYRSLTKLGRFRRLAGRLATLAGQLSVFVLLLLVLRVVDVSASEVNAVEAFAAWSLVHLLPSSRGRSAFPPRLIAYDWSSASQ